MLSDNQSERSRSIAGLPAHYFILSEANLRKILDSTDLNNAVLESLREYPFDDINKLHKIKTVLLTYKTQMVR